MTANLKLAVRLNIAGYCKQHTANEAAKKYGVPLGAVYAACHKSKVTPQKPLPNSRLSSKSLEILKLLLDGETGSDVARKHNVTRQWVSAIKTMAIKAGFDL